MQGKTKILVTGASGLVGRHILTRLSSEKNISVIGQLHRKKLHEVLASKISCAYLNLDENGVEDSLLNIAPNIIIHSAAKIPSIISSDYEVAEVNKKIDFAVFNAANKINARVIYISGINLYEGNLCPWSEGIIVSPLSAYAKQKYESELLFSKLIIPATSLRLSSPYGGTQDAGRNVLYKFIHAALNGDVLKIFGTGERRQDFIYASDIADAVWAIVSEELSGKKLSGIFNIASGSSVSMKNLAELIVDIAGRGVVVSSGEIDPQECHNPQIDIHKIWESVGWRPSTSLASGIRNIICTLRN
jgi:UDP-glucose 4-epimerase